MTLRRDSLPSFLFLCLFHLLAAPSNAAPILQAINCSTSGNYTATDAYATNVNQFLAALPENAVSKNGGFFNGTVGLGPDTVYGLAMCPADYSRADCGDCLTAAAGSDADGLRSSCPGSRTVLAMFDRCLIRYSDVNFFGTPEIGAMYTSGGESTSTSWKAYSDDLGRSFSEATARAEISPQRFASSVGRPYVLVQCTWDLPADKCKQCLDVLSTNATDFWILRREGQQRSYSCSVRYSNTSFMVVPFTAPSPPLQQSVNQTATPASPPQQSVNQTATPASPPSSSSIGARAVTVVGPVVAVVVVASLVVASIWYARRWKRQHQPKPRKTEGNFGDAALLGQGTYGAVYRGNLQVEGEGRQVAIKRIMDTKSDQSKKDFVNECTLMRRVNHKNVVDLLGFCDENGYLFLVYELIENGNLEDHLYPGENAMDLQAYTGTDPAAAPLLLDWNKRDIKPANVMLDRYSNAKLCDFGLVKLVSPNKTSQSTDNIRGTPAYIDPAYIDTSRASDQNDIYSFAILMLEVVCCQRPSLNTAGDKNILVEKVRTCYYQKNAILEAADRRLKGMSFDKQLERVLMIGLLCVQPDRHLRPSIKRVLECLTNPAASLPHIPAANHTLSTVYESGSVASTSSSRNSSYDEYSSTSSSVHSAHSRVDEDAGTAPFVTSRC
ncbi:cysteine-rich receptor-like protein kinase 10 [Lolium rigidum]|uniref:cysteine-rich receptor-like protein kinase 10 n=1 Tax=Lolium rigidum TaxID=89674 RepID=UPI001F5C32FE|nr:cysteine-rich receptor-like protein kinase 10 [Lolium rigidum]